MDAKLVIVEGDCCVAEQSVVEYIVPPGRGNGVSPVHFRTVFIVGVFVKFSGEVVFTIVYA